MSVLLKGLNISDKIDLVIENYRNSQKDAQQRTKETLQVLLERYVDNPIIDRCINGEYNLIPDFTNAFITELGLPYCIEIESKDSDTETKKLSVIRRT